MIAWISKVLREETSNVQIYLDNVFDLRPRGIEPVYTHTLPESAE